MISAAIQRVVRSTDSAFARVYLAMFRERNALMPFLFHSLFRDAGEMKLNVIDPLERTTVADFRELVKYYVEHGYRFVTPDEVLAGLGADGKYAMLTFDDGYYNNTLALPVLEEFKVPALFFISTNHVREQKCFWWDVIYREQISRGAAEQSVYLESLGMKGKRTEQIETELLSRFGADALKPRGDVDRPFTASELAEFAKHPYVHLGNHTVNHAILTNYTADEVRAQVTGAQEYLRDLTGKAPVAIAYPNGGQDDPVITACVEAGLKLGFTVRPHKTPLPVGAGSAGLMRLGRFVPHSDSSMTSQCRTYRSDFLLYGTFRDWYLRVARGQVAQ